ncbi:membrane protein [Streptomyces fumigatiscleroticus]|nr:membrane protein [Streptomyces fumigatiscleroticus]
MNALTVVLALLAAVCNASASVMQRRAAAEDPADDESARSAVRWLLRQLRRPYWLGGTALLALTTVLQAVALAVGSLAVVQPLMASELLFTLVVGSVVFRRRPDRRTWLAFTALAVGLALFLAAAAPATGGSVAPSGRWAVAGAALLCLVAGLMAVARLVRGAPRAALAGLASAVAFGGTAALLKEVMGRLPDGVAPLLGHWSPYAALAAGALAFLLLQSAFRAGTLAASQPSLTLGDALTSVALGWYLFGEQIALGVRVLPEVLGVVLIGAGSLGLARAPSVHGTWDTAPGVRADEDDAEGEAHV